MANVDFPMGALPVKNAYGGSLIAHKHNTISATIYARDFVIQEATGSIDIGVTDVDLLGTAAHYSTGDNQEQHIYDAPGNVYMIQCTASIATTDKWGAANILATAQSVAFSLSLHEIKTVASGAFQLIVLDKVDRPDNAWGTNVDVLAMIHEYERAPLPSTKGGV